MRKGTSRFSGAHPLLGGVLAAMLAGCGSGDLTLNEADPEAVALSPTWEQVYPIFQRECIPCHTGTQQGGDDEQEGNRSPARSLASAAGDVEPGLESCQQIINNLGDIYVDIFVDNNMPPGAWPRLTSEEKLIIERWMSGGARGPCN